MAKFVDPRRNPEPPALVRSVPSAHGEELNEFVRLCRAGRVYEVERWLQEGRPIQALTYTRPKKPKVVSPLRAAVRSRHSDIVLLLLCNGYRLDLEADGWRSVLDEALEAGDFDILELLLVVLRPGSRLAPGMYRVRLQRGGENRLARMVGLL